MARFRYRILVEYVGGSIFRNNTTTNTEIETVGISRSREEATKRAIDILTTYEKQAVHDDYRDALKGVS